MTANILFYKTSLLELTLATRTVVEPFHLPIQFPPYPKHLMPFHEVLQQPHKRFIDVIGIVIHLAPLEHIGGRPYREAILMDSRRVIFYSNNTSFIYRWDIIVVGIWPELLQRNALRNSALHDPKSEECFNQQLSREETCLSGNSGFGCVSEQHANLFDSKISDLPMNYLGVPVFFMENREQTQTNQMAHNVARTPCADISNTINTGDQNGSNSLRPIVDAKERKRQRDKERYATMSDEQKNEKNKKRREARLRNKELNKKRHEASQRNDCQNMMPNAPRGGDEKVNVDPDDDSDWLHINYTLQSNDIDATTEVLTPGSVHENVGHTPKHTRQRTAYFSERYKNLTPVEREFRRERLRLYNRTPRRKEAKVIPEFVNAPFLPSPTQTEDVTSPDMSTNTLKRKHHVPRGERQAILARRNQLFESAISRKVGTSIEDTSGDAVEGDDWTQRHTPKKITNNGDDDEGVIFKDDDDENEGYLFAAQCTIFDYYYPSKAYVNIHVLLIVFKKISDEDTDEDIKIDDTQEESTATYVSDPYDKVYSNIPEETHMLKLVPNCGYCTAKKFEYEPPGFCCRGGKVELAPVETPPQLKRLWDSADSDARHFRDNIRFFNGHFTFTSLYCCLDSMTTNVRGSGIYTFRAQGMMYHNIKSFGREGGAEHKHLELYFYDDDPSLEHRYRKCREEHQQKDKEVIKQIVDILRGNPYSEHLRTMGHVHNFDDYRIALNLDQTLNQKTYNTPLTSEMPSALRRLFATILVYCEPSDVVVLWQKHLDSMSEDYQHRNPCKTHVEQMVLIDIRNMLQSMGKDIKTFPLPPIMDAYDDAIGTAREVYEEEIIEPAAGDVALKDCLNKEQRVAYDKILSVIDTDQGGLFFVDGPGGTRKTYLYRVLLATLRSQGKIAVATATSGVAASIMPGGRTAHSRFKIPLTIDDGAVCSFTKQSGTAELLRKASLIIWDEASMTKRQVVEALDSSMRDIMGRPGLPFGSKTIVFGGDFRQVLPVVRKGSRAQVVASSLRMSYLWESMSHLKLVTNMRAKNDPWFAEYLLRVGGGTEDTNTDGDIRLPDEVCVTYSGSDNDLDNLIDFVFPNLNKNMSDSTYITSRAILSTRNEWVDMINVKMIDRFQGENMVYHSFDSAMDDPHNYYPPEFLNTLTPNGLPPHVLKLKIGCPIILLRNIDPANGLCNGTRLVVRGFQRNSIDAEIVLGQHAGKRIFLPRIPLCPSDEEMFPFQFKRKQFPVRLSFAMMVNKAQGQTIPNVGVYLPEPVFSHGQLYVALSRATARSNIKILAIPPVDGKKTSRKGVRKNPTVDCGTYTKNIVYKEVGVFMLHFLSLVYCFQMLRSPVLDMTQARIGTLVVYELKNAKETCKLSCILTSQSELEQETVKWCRQILRNSPMAIRVLKSALNAADNGHAGLQELGGNATHIFYGTEEAKEGKNAYMERRHPDFSKFPRKP
ncbi:1,4-dihydroxy-2-naphthoyl-CoA synthase, peroxisomal [Zea mays]|uniref:ATP-dependent DNA helicase n=1 Tax=Zea mays TaxID=4577 RepID=A0A317Y0L8_MAIZE|nr:1,4-dihydroxy-2-naphthoyl-CoA synthase, peroxisomal [Zea mays]